MRVLFAALTSFLTGLYAGVYCGYRIGKGDGRVEHAREARALAELESAMREEGHLRGLNGEE